MSVLEGNKVRLVPLSEDHLDALCEVGLDPEIWKWISFGVTTREEMQKWIRTALEWQAAGTAIPFVIQDKASGRIVGSTRFANMEREHRKVEIGWTFVGKDWQRTAINTEAKYLLLTHAFEKMEMKRVELKTNRFNEKSRRAIARIGGKHEGILRKHLINRDGSSRDTVYFSITDDEWPAVKKRLEEKLQGVRHEAPPVELEAFCLEWLTAWTGNQPERLRGFYSDDAFYRDPARPQGLRGEELLPYFRKLLARNPEWRWHPEEVLPTTNGFCLKWRAEIPTGQGPVEETGLDIVEMRDGKITRNEVYFDPSKLR